MKSIFLLFLTFLWCSVVAKYDYATPYDYHERIGIRKAEELRNVSRIIGGAQVPDATIIPHQVSISAD